MSCDAVVSERTVTCVHVVSTATLNMEKLNRYLMHTHNVSTQSRHNAKTTQEGAACLPVAKGISVFLCLFAAGAFEVSL